MKIIIQSPDFTPQPELLDFVNKKVDKLEHFYQRILEARVLLKTNKSDKRENKVCELRLVIPGNDLFSEHQASTFEEAVALAVDAIKRQVVDFKEKRG